MRDDAVADAIEFALGRRPVAFCNLSGGCIADIRRVDLGGDTVVAKFAGADESLETEAYMLRYLAAHSDLPVPGVLYADPQLLVMDYVETSGRLDAGAEAHAAELLAALHAVGAERFGHERDTVIGSLPQPNPWTDDWLGFFRDRRLLYMAEQAHMAGRLPGALRGRIDRLADRLDEWLEEPAAPSLIHGDMWGGNVLVRESRIAAFVDPAIYYADAEIELAFATLFSTFGDVFFGRYTEMRPLSPGFFEARRDLYNLYPLLVHVRLFGGGYVDSVARSLTRFGV